MLKSAGEYLQTGRATALVQLDDDDSFQFHLIVVWVSNGGKVLSCVVEDI